MWLLGKFLADSRFWRFAAVGGVFALTNLLMLRVLVGEFGWGYLFACSVAFILLNFGSYWFNKRVTYGLGSRISRVEVARYYFVMAVSLAINLSLMYVLVDVIGLDYLVASIFVTVLLAAGNFVAHLNLTFRGAYVRSDRVSSVLMVSAFFPAHGGGIEVVAGELVVGLRAVGLNVQWMAGGKRGELPIELSEKGVELEFAKSIDFLERRLGLPLPMWGWDSMVSLWRRVGRADVVHVHDFLYMPTLLAMLFSLLRGRPVVLTQHIGGIPFKSLISRGVLFCLNRTIGRLVLSSVNQVVFVGRPVLEYFDKFVRFRAKPRLVSNGVDHRKYFPLDREVSEVDGCCNILFVGRFVEKKGVALLRGCIDLPGVDWTFIGWGPLSPLCWADELPANVRVFEGLRSEQLVPYFQEADLLVLPSTGEGFPLVVQEALSCGTPVLVSREVADAFPSIDPDCVFDVELRCVSPEVRLRTALAALVSDPTRLAAARRVAHTLSLQWSWENCVDDYLDLYRGVVSRTV